MSLLDRMEVREVSPQRARGDELSSYTEMLRKMLYAQFPSEQIARIMDADLDRASREVNSALEIAMRSSRFSRLSDEDKQRCAKEVYDMVVGLGPIQPLMENPEITEVMVNGPRSVYYEKDGRLHRSDVSFRDEKQMRLVIDRILGPVGRRVDEQSPMVSARLPDGHRANIVIAPLALDGPYITIRKFRNRAYTLEEMCELGTIDEAVSTFLKWSVKARKNIAVSGGTGSGKTTFLNALSNELPHDERVITIEDSAELRFDSHPHVVRMEARPMNTEGVGEVTIRDLVTNALRMRPDRIVVGECRGPEALDMLQAMNTGHDGSLTTLHANSSHEVVGRLVMMVRFGSELPVRVIEDQIASALDLVVHLVRQRDGKRRVLEIDSCSNGENGVELHPCAVWSKENHGYVWKVPSWIAQLSESGICGKAEVERWESRLSLR